MDNIYIKFIYKTQEIKIMANINDSMKDIFKRFFEKTNIIENTNNFYFLCEGEYIDEEMKLSQIIKNKENELNILVNSDNKTINQQTKVISKLIICPNCGENCIFNIKDYKIDLNQCDNGHNISNIFIEEFNNTQIIDESKIKCSQCNNSKNKIYGGKFYFCCKCNYDLCPLCKSNHSQEHLILDYELKNYRCKIHGERYILYCETCKKNLCDLCEIEHNRNHQFIVKLK